MKYFLEIEGREMEVELDPTPDGLMASIDGGERRLVRFTDVDQLGQYSLIIGNQSYAVSLEEERGEFDVEIAGQAFRVRCEDERERAARALDTGSGSGDNVVEAVMPGIVVKIEVEVGQTVEPGQTLVILEAMKMQNEIKADGAGTVKLVHVKQGDTVGAGEILIELEPPAEG